MAGESATSVFRERLLRGEAVDTAAFVAEFGTTAPNVYSMAYRLRQDGIAVVREDGAYRLDKVSKKEIEAALARTKHGTAAARRNAVRAVAADYPPLGATLRVVRVELTGRRVLTTLDDGQQQWHCVMFGTADEVDEPE